MANTAAIAKTFRVDLFKGLHAFGTTVVRGATTKDTFKGALFLVSATINADTAAYSATGEVSGTGYTAGGVAITNATEPANTGGTGIVAFWTPSASLVWTTVTLATAFDCLELYNDTAVGKNTVAVFTFGSTTVTSGNFTLTLPVNDLATGLIRLA